MTALEAAGMEAEDAPAGTVTEAGRLTDARLEDVATTTPPAGAGPDSVIEQTLESPPAIVPGLQTREESNACPDTTVIVPDELETPCEVPPPVAP